MTEKLIIIAAFGGFVWIVYGMCMRSTPRKGVMRVIETLCLGIILCYLCQAALNPLGIKIAQSPLAALSAGFLGLPGVAFSSVLAVWP